MEGVKITSTRTFWIGVFGSIVGAFLFVYFFDPILSFFGRNLIVVLSKTWSFLLDRIYSEIAVGSLDYAHVIFVWIGLGFLGVLTGGVVAFILNSKIVNTKSLVKVDKRIPTYAFLLSLSVSYVLVAYSIVISFIGLKTITSFEQHMNIIRPYVQETEYHMLKSRWALMNSYLDYRKIVSELETIAENNDIKLPDNKLYPFM